MLIGGALVTALALSLALSACSRSRREPRHRARDASRDGDCLEPARPHAYFYPAENRTDYKPDDPRKDDCVLLVADHLFCCPDRPRDVDR